jgi:hypothetical protein
MTGSRFPAVRYLLAWAGVGAAVLASGCGIGNAQARLRSAIDARKPSLDQCYAATLERDKGAAGDMRMWVSVDKRSGAVEKVEVLESAIDDPTLGQCVQDTVGQVKMDPKPKRGLKVEYTLRFSPST